MGSRHAEERVGIEPRQTLLVHHGVDHRHRGAVHRLIEVSVPGDGDESEVLSFADLSMDLATREVRRGERTMELTRTEFTLLEMFLRRPRRVLERSFILEEVWGYDFPTTANSLEVYVGYLRRKTEAGEETRLIHTVRGVGYVLKEA